MGHAMKTESLISLWPETDLGDFYDFRGRVVQLLPQVGHVQSSLHGTQVPQWPSVQLGCCPTSLYLVGSFGRLHRVVGDWLRVLGVWPCR